MLGELTRIRHAFWVLPFSFLDLFPDRVLIFFKVERLSETDIGHLFDFVIESILFPDFSHPKGQMLFMRFYLAPKIATLCKCRPFLIEPLRSIQVAFVYLGHTVASFLRWLIVPHIDAKWLIILSITTSLSLL